MLSGMIKRCGLNFDIFHDIYFARHISKADICKSQSAGKIKKKISKIKLEDKMWITMISVIFVFLSHSKQHVKLSI